MAEPDVPDRNPPWPLVAALVGVLVEAIALAVAAVVLVAEVALGRAEAIASTVATGVFAAVLAVVLAAGARALWRGRRWGRGPLVTWQVLQGAVALSQVGSPWLVALLVGLAAGITVGLLGPGSIAATSVRGGPSPFD